MPSRSVGVCWCTEVCIYMERCRLRYACVSLVVMAGRKGPVQEEEEEEKEETRNKEPPPDKKEGQVCKQSACEPPRALGRGCGSAARGFYGLWKWGRIRV